MTLGKPYPHQRARLKTYSHLEAKKRIPTEYELTTSNLLYYPDRDFAVATPIQAWYQKYQKQSSLQCKNWEHFVDPREMTYTKYTSTQKDKEVFVEGIFKAIDATKYDSKLSPNWLKALETILPVLRYPYHGLQMCSAYVGSMAPSGRIVIPLLAQTANEMRITQTFTYRMVQLQSTQAGFGQNALQQWQELAAWQGWREAIEKLLVTYDWGEAFTGLNLCLKPLFDQLFLVQFGYLSQANGDYHLQEILLSLEDDALWQREWTQELVALILQEDPSQKKILEAWIRKWWPSAKQAAEIFVTHTERLLPANSEGLLKDTFAHYNSFLHKMGLEHE